MKFTEIENSLEQERRRLPTQLQRIEGALYALANIQYGTDTVKRSASSVKQKSVVSAASRRKMAASHKARWAKPKKGK